MVQQVTERISLHEAVEASLRIRLVEVEREKDAYLRCVGRFVGLLVCSADFFLKDR